MMSDYSADDDDDLPEDVPQEPSTDIGEGMHGFTVNSVGRFDKIMAGLCPSLSRTRIKALIQDGCVTLDGAACRDPSRLVTDGQIVTIDVPAPVRSHPQAESIPLDIIYEDDHLLVINKPAGLVVHPGAGNHSGTLVNALLAHCGDTLSGIGGVLRPGIVHRLDKDTSGLMVVAKSDRAHRGLAEQLSDRSLSREYLALVWKIPTPPVGRIEASLGRSTVNRQRMVVTRRQGRHAVTHYRCEEFFGRAATLVRCKLETGRTHQIRVHMDYLGHPLIGDQSYGMQPTGQRALLKKETLDPEAIETIIAFPRQALHATEIAFIHPATGEAMGFDVAPPDDFTDLVDLLRG